MDKRIEEYGKTLLARLDEQTDGRMFTRYDIEVAQMGFRDGFNAAIKEMATYVKYLQVAGEMDGYED